MRRNDGGFLPEAVATSQDDYTDQVCVRSDRSDTVPDEAERAFVVAVVDLPELGASAVKLE